MGNMSNTNEFENICAEFEFDANNFNNIYIHELGGRAEIISVVRIGLSNEIEYDIRLLDRISMYGDKQLRILQEKFHKEFRVYGTKIVSEKQKESGRKQIIEYLSEVDRFKTEGISLLRKENKDLKAVNDYLMKYIIQSK